jgi:F-type H+-transporting ATPase subunit a
MTTSVEEKRGWRWGVNRWLVLLFIVLGVFAAQAFPPILPHVQLPAEELTGPILDLPVVGEIPLTNTIVAVLLGDVILLLMAFAVNRAIRRGDLVPGGIVGAVEAVLEGLYQLAQSTAGKWAKSIFPWMATIVLVVLMANWLELLPGVDSIGIFDSHHIPHPEECEFTSLFTIGSMEAIAVGGDSECASGVVPFVRVASTDLNFTLALALIVVFMTQVFGVRSLGVSYFTKFINVKPLFSKPFFGAIDFAVGLLELISETSRIISFSFRLFGNIFAGSILLFVIGSLVPVFAQTMFLILEFFVGLIQAIVFGMLAMIFMSQATVGHGDEHH